MARIGNIRRGWIVGGWTAILKAHSTYSMTRTDRCSRKSLLPVILHYPSSSKTPHCPSCSRELSNAVPSVLLTSRQPAIPPSTNGAETDEPAPKKKKKSDKSKEEPLVCGHVFCKTCADSIVLPAGRCSVCEAKIAKEGMVPMGKEGEFPVDSVISQTLCERLIGQVLGLQRLADQR